MMLNAFVVSVFMLQISACVDYVFAFGFLHFNGVHTCYTFDLSLKHQLQLHCVLLGLLCALVSFSTVKMITFKSINKSFL